jgi:hypothetical protein
MTEAFRLGMMVTWTVEAEANVRGCPLKMDKTKWKSRSGRGLKERVPRVIPRFRASTAGWMVLPFTEIRCDGRRV